ncbi:hypothetical protein D6C92_01540 [Aureobasidium pullulans]|nr:hypothetical protein D6C92_01540 [Aureobasidium pullulans]
MVIMFDTKVKRLLLDGGGGIAGVEATHLNKGDSISHLYAPSVILCAGDILFAALDLDAQKAGDSSHTGCQSVGWDADSPPDSSDRDKTDEFAKSGYPLGLMLNIRGQRFVDEGFELRNYIYAKFGRAILEQPQGIAYQVWDADTVDWLREEEFRDDIVRKIRTQSLEWSAQKLSAEGLTDPHTFTGTTNHYNAAVHAHRDEHQDVKLDPSVKDEFSTRSSRMALELPKSNWALPVEKRPFTAVRVTSGITLRLEDWQLSPVRQM